VIGFSFCAFSLVALESSARLAGRVAGAVDAAGGPRLGLRGWFLPVPHDDQRYDTEKTDDGEAVHKVFQRGSNGLIDLFLSRHIISSK
jgi:hypothetical protein